MPRIIRILKALVNYPWLLLLNGYRLFRLEDDMRAEGKIISMDYIPPEDKEWLKKDIEDSIDLAGGRYEIPFYENKEWIRQFGKKP